MNKLNNADAGPGHMQVIDDRLRPHSESSVVGQIRRLDDDGRLPNSAHHLSRDLSSFIYPPLWSFSTRVMSDVPSPPPFLRQVYDLRGGDGLHSLNAGRERSRDPPPSTHKQGGPYVTLTFAQSLDAKIAGQGGKQLALSGKESMVMTHW